MTKKNFCLLLTCLFFAGSLFAQDKTPAKKPAPAKATKKWTFTTDPVTKVTYHFFHHDKKGKKPAMGDFANVVMVYKTEGDSVIFDSHHNRLADSLGTIRLEIKKNFEGCLEQGISMMAVGDSAAFKISVDSTFLKAFKQRAVPPSVRMYKYFVFYIKLQKSMTTDEIKAEQQKAIDAKKGQEHMAIARYLKDSNYTVTPTPDSLYILKHITTNGTAIEEGDSIYAVYVGKLTSGRIFDQSAIHGGQGGFVTVGGQPALAMVYSKNMRLITAWVEMLGMMHEGDKATILSPSSLAYGDHGAGPSIGPYTPLIFDLEIVRVAKLKK